MPYVFSTSTADVAYASYRKNVKGHHTIEKRVLIKGGSNVITKSLVTPLGVVTKVSDEDMAFLEANSTFQKHKKAGFVQVRNGRADPEKVVAGGMNSKDESAPLTPGDFPKNEPKLASMGVH